MTSFLFGLISGITSLAALLSLPPETIDMMIGIAAGLALGLTFIYLYLLATLPPHKRKTQRRPAQRRYPKGWPLAGQMALSGGLA